MRPSSIVRVTVMAGAIFASVPAWGAELPDTLPSHAGVVVEHADSSSFGLRTSLTRVRYGDGRASSPSFTLAGRHEEFGQEGPLSIRVVNTFALGGGPDGLAGHLGMSISGGLRGEVTKNQGPMARMGGEFEITGSPVLYHSLLEIPQLQMGYQWLSHGKLLEAGMKTGYVVAGYYRPDDAGRPLGGSFEWGAFGNMNLEPFRLRGTFSRILADAPQPALTTFQAEACGRARPLIVCTDAQFFFGEAGDRSRGTLFDSRSITIGFTIGLAQKK